MTSKSHQYAALTVATLCLILAGCTSAMKAVTGTYAYYSIIDTEVVYFSWNPMSQRFSKSVLVSADPATFVPIDHKHGKDATQVFQGSQIIAHADPKSFRLTSDGYAIDTSHIFYGRSRLEGADIATFKRLGHGWSRDAHQVYFGNKRLNVCDMDTFAVIPRWRALDSECYYSEATRVPIQDRSSLEVLGGGYAKDKFQVYWLNQVVTDAKTESFKVKSVSPNSIARDATQCFGGPRIVACDSLNAEGKAFCPCE